MWFFALLAIALVGVSLALLLRPLLSGKPSSDGSDASDANLDIHRQRLHALDAEWDADRITTQERDSAREEIEREVLGDLEAGAPVTANRSSARRTALVVALALPILGFGIYFHLGAWHSLMEDPPDSSALLEPLEAAVRANPRDTVAWVALGRASVALERYHHGLQAFAEARRLTGERPDLLADYAEAEALFSGYRFQGSPARLLERALELDPRHAKSLWLAGFAALQSAQPERAIERWQTLLAVGKAGAEQTAMIEALIARTREETGAAPERAAAEDEETAPVLVVSVRLDERFRGELDGNESLFVYARAAGGPPVPLAAQRDAARALPLTLRLDDSMSMLPDRTLSSAERVVVGARVSRSGDARAASGDIQGMSEAVDIRPGEIAVEVLLNERIP